MATENKIIYQTVADRGNPSYVENHGPFLCKRDPWFGEGYYFWDSYVELAHWWGKIGYHGRYMIAKVVYPYDPSSFFDITGDNINNTMDFKECIIEYFGSLDAEYTIPQVIELMKKRTDLTEKYRGIKARGVHKMYDLQENNLTLKKNKSYRFELYPPNQLCFFNKSSLSKCRFQIVWPEEYTQAEPVDLTNTYI